MINITSILSERRKPVSSGNFQHFYPNRHGWLRPNGFTFGWN